MWFSGTSSLLERAAVWLLLPALALDSPVMACACACAATDSPASCCAMDSEVAAESCCCSRGETDCSCSPQHQSERNTTGGCDCTVQAVSPTVPGGPFVQLDPPLAAGWLTNHDVHTELSGVSFHLAQAADIPIRDLVIELRVLRI